MTAKRFTNHIIKEDVDGTLHSDGILDAEEDNKIVIWNYFYIANLLNNLHEENIKLKWILTNYNPQNLPIPSKEEMKDFIEMLYGGDLE